MIYYRIGPNCVGNLLDCCQTIKLANHTVRPMRYCVTPSVLWRCWLGGIRPVKPEWWGAGRVICLELGADLHVAQLMSLPLTVSCFSEIQIGFTFLVPAHPGSPGQRAVKRVCVCVCVQWRSHTRGARTPCQENAYFLVCDFSVL